MKLFSQLLVLGLAAEVTVASNWFSKSGMFEAFSSCLPLSGAVRTYLSFAKLLYLILDSFSRF
jgi:hypothetical protein